MPSLIVDEKGTEFFYLDSGPPPKEIYTTVVAVHGHTFHSGTFKRLIPLALSKALRLICLNRRDYAGSTLYSDSELAVLSEGDERERTSFMEARGIEIALFLHRLIQEHSLPMPTPRGNEGGLALMGWSLGNAFSISTIASVSLLSETVKLQLQMYLRKVVVFGGFDHRIVQSTAAELSLLQDPPSLSLGFPDPPKNYNPLSDETIPQDQRGAAFAYWASSYFEHGDLSSRDINTLSYKDPNPLRAASVSKMSPEALGSTMDIGPAVRSEMFLITRFDTSLYQKTCKALFDPDTRRSWPRTDVWVLHGDSSPWNIIFAAWEIEKGAKAADLPVKFLVMKDAHHFVLWDEPEKTIEALLHCLQS